LIIPTYKQYNRLKLCLLSIEQQTYAHDMFEVIVIDDGSNENVERILNEINISYSINIISLKKNAGRSFVRNLGAKELNVDLLIFNDGDRIMHKNFIAEHVNYHKDDQTVVIGNVLELFLSDYDELINDYIQKYLINEVALFKRARYFNYAECIYNIYNDQGDTSSTVPWLSLFSGNFSIMQDIYLYNNGFNENFKDWGLENFEFGYRLYKNSCRFRYNSKASNFHIFHENNRESRTNNLNLFASIHTEFEPDKLDAFLKGELSLQEYDRGNTYQNDKPIIFQKTRYGSRYREIF